MYSEITIKKMNDIANRYQPLLYKSIRDVLSQPKYKNTGLGLESVTVEVVLGDANKSPQLVTKFDDRLVFIGLKKMQWIKLPDMKKMLEWAETKKSDPKEAKQLAWAVAWDKKKNDTWKPKQWRKKSLSAVLTEMNELILKEFDAAINEDLIDAIKRSQN